MRRLRVFRWSDSLIPGFLFILFFTLTFLPKKETITFFKNVGPSEITIGILVGGFIGYILGTVVWGIAYIIRAGSIISITIGYVEKISSAGYNNINIGEFSQQDEKTERIKYRSRRLGIANEILNNIETERDKYVGYNPHITFKKLPRVQTSNIQYRRESS